MRQPYPHRRQTQALQHLLAQQNELHIAAGLSVAQELDAALPALAGLVAGGEAENVLNVEQLGQLLAPHVFHEQPRGTDGGFGAKDDALSAPAVPVQESVDATQHVGRQGAGGREQVQMLDRRRPHLPVAPGQTHVAEGRFDAAEAGHIGRQQVAHATTAQGLVGHRETFPVGVGLILPQACTVFKRWRPFSRSS
jgi:hypothetical protein